MQENKEKTLDVTSVADLKEKVSDVVVFGNGDLFKLISKVSSKAEGWMKSTKAMEIEAVGCVVQVTTQQGNNIAEAITFVPGVRIKEEYNTEQVATVTSRKLVKI